MDEGLIRCKPVEKIIPYENGRTIEHADRQVRILRKNFGVIPTERGGRMKLERTRWLGPLRRIYLFFSAMTS
jgi:hypothetical protein